MESKKNAITEVYIYYLNENDNKPPAIRELRDLLNERLRPEMAPEKVDDFLVYYQRFIANLSNKINPKTGLSISSYTILGHKRTMALLKDFKSKIPFEKIDANFYYDFLEYLNTKHTFATNTIGRHIKSWKTVLFEASEDYKNVFVSK